MELESEPKPKSESTRSGRYERSEKAEERSDEDRSERGDRSARAASASLIGGSELELQSFVVPPSVRALSAWLLPMPRVHTPTPASPS
jgi:hypothetical protein